METKAKLTGELLTIAEISTCDATRMFQLMSEYYENVCPDRFNRDLAAKDRALILRDPAGVIKGFTSIKIERLNVEGLPVQLVFSGDTIVHPDCWGDRELHRSWIRSVKSLAGDREIKTYWLLISKGYKTYRFLPVYFHRFYPCWEQPTPEFEKKIMDQFGVTNNPEHYDCHSGVIRLRGARDYLKPGVADLSEKRLADPHVRFFVERNPGHVYGDELVCLAELGDENILPAGRRYLGKNYRQ